MSQVRIQISRIPTAEKKTVTPTLIPSLWTRLLNALQIWTTIPHTTPVSIASMLIIYAYPLQSEIQLMPVQQVMVSTCEHKIHV